MCTFCAYCHFFVSSLIPSYCMLLFRLILELTLLQYVREQNALNIQIVGNYFAALQLRLCIKHFLSLVIHLGCCLLGVRVL
jgi:hypothetical protein